MRDNREHLRNLLICSTKRETRRTKGIVLIQDAKGVNWHSRANDCFSGNEDLA